MSRPPATFHTGELPEAAQGMPKVEATDIPGMPSEYAQQASWESLVKTVFTVFQTPDGKQHVLFITTANKLTKEELSVCVQRFPNKLRAFFGQSMTMVQT
ncbi:hypothetical protein BDN70DRAFT_927479 [Pholiota conissans]|uniref:Uncharacterized protein n=1 Tax=Pholiota conissans TaxID=109636 RepID=A0A9P6CZS0_9AGAR|nr:hypothetical protein BDN70DRAFT_927479 [Pholiota conissans]